MSKKFIILITILVLLIGSVIFLKMGNIGSVAFWNQGGNGV